MQHGEDHVKPKGGMLSLSKLYLRVKSSKKFNTNFSVPIMYFTELMGLAFGIKPKELGLFKHLTEVDDFLKERALI